MPIKRPQLVTGEIYHIVTRAIDGLKLFREDRDYSRMIHDLFEFNSESAVFSTFRWRWRLNNQPSRTVLDGDGRKLLGEILAFCLMPNHIHLLIKQVRDGGISKFMRKVGAGYGLYYNKKYKRAGHVFQGRYRMIHIKNDKQLKTVFVYIHTNPAAIIVPRWKERGIKNYKKAIKFLEKYRWSSYLDYLGRKNFPSLTSRDFLLKIMDGSRGSKEFVDSWLKFKKELSDFDQVAIE